MITSNSQAMASAAVAIALPMQSVAPQADKSTTVSSVKSVQPVSSVTVSIGTSASHSPVYSFKSSTVVNPVLVQSVSATTGNDAARENDPGRINAAVDDSNAAQSSPVSIVGEGGDEGSVAAVVNPRQSTGDVVGDDTSASEDRNTPSEKKAPPQERGGASEDSAEQTQNAEIVQKLQARDREVRQHESQHKSVGGQYAGSISYQYQSGPNGQQYAVGGEVDISVSEVPGNPQATINKMQTVRAAALAPAEPSSQDRAVAAAATRIILSAQQSLAQSREDQRVAQVQEQEDARAVRQANQESSEKSSNEIETYKGFLELGHRLDQGLVPEINLDELV